MNKQIPDQYVGAWQRQGIEVGDAPLMEDSRVIWLQSPTRYADIRVPADPTTTSHPGSESFAGPLHWREPNLTFVHELDYTHNHPDDQGDLSWQGETLIETGSAQVQGKTIAYREYWRRLSPKNPDYECWEVRGDDRLTAIAIRVDIHAYVISEESRFGASYYTREGNEWRKQRGIGSEPENVFADSPSAPWVLIDHHQC